MKKIIIFILITFLIINPSYSHRKPENFQKMKDSTVSVVGYDDTHEYTCTGVVLCNNDNNVYIATAKHCIVYEGYMFVEGKDVIHAYVDKNNDVAILKINEIIYGKYSVQFGKGLEKYKDKLYAIGYPGRKEYYNDGYFLYIINKLFINLKLIPGCSGGPIFNEKAELVGLGVATFPGLFRKLSKVEPLINVLNLYNEVLKIQLGELKYE